jgi:TrkA domain protein
MRDVTETELPGVGVRFDLQTESGRRDLVVYDQKDPDRAGESVKLREDEGHTLGEMLGGSRVVQHLDEAVHRLEDLVISWVKIDPKSSLAGLTLTEASLRTRTGAGVVALVSDSGSTPVPGGAAILEASSTAVLVGEASAVEAASKLLAAET